MATPFPFVSGAILTAAQLNAITELPVTTKVASYVLVAADSGYNVVMNLGTPTTITVNASLFQAGQVVRIHNIGAGVCTITAGTATVTTTGSLALAASGGGLLYFVSASAAIFYPAGGSASKVVQIVSTQVGSVATGTTVFPHDDTIPQITEGDQYMTLAITPTNVNNNLDIAVVFYGASSVLAHVGVGLFVGITADALAAITQTIPTGDYMSTTTLRHRMVAGSVSALTFRVRAGPSVAATVTFNGRVGGRLFGGVAGSSIMITESTP